MAEEKPQKKQHVLAAADAETGNQNHQEWPRQQTERTGLVVVGGHGHELPPPCCCGGLLFWRGGATGEWLRRRPGAA